MVKSKDNTMAFKTLGEGARTLVPDDRPLSYCIRQ